jgi:hypothetical protein
LPLLDLAVGAIASTAAATRPVRRRVAAVAAPVAQVALRPPVLASRFQPATWLTGLTRSGEERRTELFRALSALLDELVPLVAEALLRRMDLTGVVQRFVDLDEVVAGVDLDGVASRLDIDAVARRLDLDSVVARLDLTGIVRDQVDLDALVASVDLNAAAARLDLDAVIERIDLVGLAEDVIAEVDLPEIIRESTGSMASETVRGVRMQSISGDQALGRAVDRLRLRRGRREAADGPDGSRTAEDVAAQHRPGPTERP